MPANILRRLWSRAIPRAGLIHLGLLFAAFFIAALVAWPLGFGVSLLGILILYGLASVGFSAWLMRGKAEEEDEDTLALAAFAEEPLGALIADAKDRLASARRKVGRDATMYQPLNRLVRTTRKIELRLARKPELRPHLNRVLSRQLPLIATTAEQYVGLRRSESLSREQADRLIVAEGVLREAGDRMDQLAEANAKPDGATIGLIRMDANAEVLAEQLSADMDAVTLRASALRGAHSLKQTAKSADEDLAARMRDAAARIERMASDDEVSLRELVSGDLSEMVASAEALADTGDAEAVGRIREHLDRLAQMENRTTS